MAPNRELAAAIFDAIERHHRACGREVWPTPRVRDFSTWLREQHERRLASGAATARCLDEVEERLLWREILAEDGREGALLDPDGAAAAARRARRAIREHAIPAGSLAAYATEDTVLLGAWIERFERRCRELGCISADDLLGRFAAAPEPVVRIDSPAWRPAARRWLDTQADATIAPPEVARRSAWSCLTAADAEFAAAADWLRARLLERPDFRAWVLIPELASYRAEVADAFDAALAPQRLRLQTAEGIAPYAIAGGTPLADYPQVAAALDLVALARGTVPFERFSALLRAPGLQPDAAAAALSARVDVELRAAAPFEAGLGAWLDLAERARRRAQLPPCAALARLGAALGALEPAGGALRMSRWVALWVRAFDAAPWADRERWSSAEYQSVERFRELLVQLASADALFGTLGAGAAAALLRAAAREVAFQPQTGIPPIWITSQVADPWLCYDALWIGGLSAEAWPPPIDPVPLLPVDLQRRYGVERASSAACLEAALDLGRRWARRAPVAVFGLSDRDESRSAAPSPLLGASLAQLDLDAAATVPRLWAELRARAPALDALVDEAAPPLAPGETTRGVATLRAQSLCAFRGFADSRLRCEPLRLPQPGFDPAERGILVHAALEHIWAALGDRAALAALDAPARAQLVSTATAAAVEAARARRDPGPRWRDRERGRLERLLARWLDLERERTDFAVERLEQGRQIARHAGLEFSCRIDRVDRLADGSRVLIDYKTGITSTDWRGERPANPQLPLYAGLAGDRLVAVAYAQVSAADCRFVAETERADALVPGGRRTSLEGARDLRELMERWRSRLDRLAAEFRDGRAAVDPMPRACETCRLQVLCRIGDGADVEQADE